MHSAIFVVNPRTDQEWADFQSYAERKAAQFEGAARLAVNVWLLDLGKAVGLLGLLVGKAETAGLPYGVLPLAEQPTWLPTSFCPAPMPNQNV